MSIKDEFNIGKKLKDLGFNKPDLQFDNDSDESFEDFEDFANQFRSDLYKNLGIPLSLAEQKFETDNNELGMSFIEINAPPAQLILNKSELENESLIFDADLNTPFYFFDNIQESKELDYSDIVSNELKKTIYSNSISISKKEFDERVILKESQNKIQILLSIPDFEKFFKQWNYNIHDFETKYPENKTIFYLTHDQFVNFEEDLRVLERVICCYKGPFHDVKLKEYKKPQNKMKKMAKNFKNALLKSEKSFKNLAVQLAAIECLNYDPAVRAKLILCESEKELKEINKRIVPDLQNKICDHKNPKTLPRLDPQSGKFDQVCKKCGEIISDDDD